VEEKRKFTVNQHNKTNELKYKVKIIYSCTKNISHKRKNITRFNCIE